MILEKSHVRSAFGLSVIAVLLLYSASAFAVQQGQQAHGDAHQHAHDDAHQHADEHAEATPAEHLKAMEAMCAAGSEAAAARHAEKTLYERLGGEEKIREVVVEVMRLHLENDAIKRLFESVDLERAIDKVTEFLVAGTGGPKEYMGKELTQGHAYMQLTNADFLAAGADVMQAMKNKEIGENEINEVICAFVSLRPAVVMESERELH